MYALRRHLELNPKRRLDAAKIIETAKSFAADVNVGLPGSTLAALAVATEERGRQARRPFLAIRAFSALSISVVILGLWYLDRHIHTKW